MAHYDVVQRVSKAMIWVKKNCRELSPRFAEVQNALDAIGDCAVIRAESEKKGKTAVTHLVLAKYRQKTAEANAHVEMANALMAEVHAGLSEEAVIAGLDDHVYQKNGGGER